LPLDKKIIKIKKEKERKKIKKGGTFKDWDFSIYNIGQEYHSRN
jgi:hypothetical protein